MNPPSDSGPRRALGRGLAALIPNPTDAVPSPAPPKLESVPPGIGYQVLPIESIEPNPEQPRKVFAAEALAELAESIREHGVVQPIVVRRTSNRRYQIVAGERRWRATGLAGRQNIPALVKECSDADALKVALLENIQRQDLDPLEEAEAYRRLMRDHELNQEQVAKSVGKSRAAVANSLRLLKLPGAVLDMLGQGKLTAGHARALMTLESDSEILKLAQDAVKRGSSVRELERRARMLKRSARASRRLAPSTPAEQQVETRLMRALSTKVRLRQRGGKGRIEIYFHSLAELDSLLAKLDPPAL